MVLNGFAAYVNGSVLRRLTQTEEADSGRAYDNGRFYWGAISRSTTTDGSVGIG